VARKRSGKQTFIGLKTHAAQDQHLLEPWGPRQYGRFTTDKDHVQPVKSFDGQWVYKGAVGLVNVFVQPVVWGSLHVDMNVLQITGGHHNVAKFFPTTSCGVRRTIPVHEKDTNHAVAVAVAVVVG